MSCVFVCVCSLRAWKIFTREKTHKNTAVTSSFITPSCWCVCFITLSSPVSSNVRCVCQCVSDKLNKASLIRLFTSLFLRGPAETTWASAIPTLSLSRFRPLLLPGTHNEISILILILRDVFFPPSVMKRGIFFPFLFFSFVYFYLSESVCKQEKGFYSLPCAAINVKQRYTMKNTRWAANSNRKPQRLSEHIDQKLVLQTTGNSIESVSFSDGAPPLWSL